MKSFINHEEAREQIPDKVLEHLDMLIKDSGLGGVKNVQDKMIELWLLKKASFQRMSEHSGFIPASLVKKDTLSGCSLLTESGSLLIIGPSIGGKRTLSYTSIGLRTDVPKSLNEHGIELKSDIECGKPLMLSGGKLERTSIISDIALRPQLEPVDIQQEKLDKARSKIEGEFVGHNRQAMAKTNEKDVLPDRDDLFSQWIINTWFELGGLAKHVFMARSKMLWLELFPGVYEHLSKKHGSDKARNNAFLDFTNNKFSSFCDDYKWYESEKKDFDIGLMKALEELPEYEAYKRFVAKYCS